MRTPSRTIPAIAAIVLSGGLMVAGCTGDAGRNAVWTGPAFSAELVDLQHPDKAPTRIFLSAGRIRLETQDSSSPLGALVLDPAHGTTLLINQANRSYIDAGMFSSVAAASFAPLLKFFRPASSGDPCTGWNSTVGQYSVFIKQRKSEQPPHFTCRSLGAESVGGRPAQKWAVTTDASPPDAGMVWIDDRLHIVSRSKDQDGGMEMRNVREAPQPDSLFAAPADYRKLSAASIMGDLLKGSDTKR